ncbi:related to arsenic methyltransferase Cyt19 [Fusarium torulosum]|uniref:Arsenite methyltransferase n=1 Tax=Fusarium torulosum TaxID=33205 RepID=A0AAE8M7J8_9HYPO|nr:related to arsenic methyltransferase Cyt19 [Fusarium torulosum]
MNSEDIYAHVSERYGTAAKGSDAKYSNTVARAFGYSEEELASIPKDANLGLSCGTPLATATLREGEVVIDLGSGAGLDVFLSAKKVGPSGKAIGVDMNKASRIYTPYRTSTNTVCGQDMLAKAMALKTDHAMNNVEFVESRITNIALEDSIADCIISNCVINLVPHNEKQQVFNEIFRLLKPGGRVAISDILAKKPFSDNIRNSIALYVGCVAGASQVDEYEQYMLNAGFEDPSIADTRSDLNVYLYDSAGGCCSATKTMALDLEGEDLNEWFGSFTIYGVKK